ncbi:MAG TPA: DUF2071 domain-containing protein [Puia sp.]|nr:DUF2071 domain-containing protein [Puia sp.]
MSTTLFLTAEWRKLIMANYAVDPADLKPLLPARTELDKWDGEVYVSLVGFQFREVRVRGLSIPFHTRFPEVNLRFYIRFKEGETWKRGVVFIREIVPLPAVTFVANTLFRERYISLPMAYQENLDNQSRTLRSAYRWKFKGRWNQLSVLADSVSQPLITGSQEEFITEHFWGYAHAGTNRTNEYQVAHPGWDLYPVKEYEVECDFGKLYGPAFGTLETRQPQSVFLAEGSPVKVYSKKKV